MEFYGLTFSGKTLSTTLSYYDPEKYDLVPKVDYIKKQLEEKKMERDSYAARMSELTGEIKELEKALKDREKEKG